MRAAINYEREENEQHLKSFKDFQRVRTTYLVFNRVIEKLSKLGAISKGQAANI